MVKGFLEAPLEHDSAPAPTVLVLSGGPPEHEEGLRERTSQDVLGKWTDVITALSPWPHLRWCMVGLKGALPR